MFPTGDPVIDALAAEAGGWATPVPEGKAQRNILAYALIRASENLGLVVSRAMVPVGNTVIVAVNDRLLAMLGYADKAAYAAALATPGFIHPADIAVVEDHIGHDSTAMYDARLRRSNGAYREVRIQGVTILFGHDEYRFSLIEPTAG